MASWGHDAIARWLVTPSSMAVISSTQDALVVRIVYDGPPMAGKTTSLRTLASKLGSPVQTPAEIDGRTVYFDWLDYTGGLFEGRRIRCQIVSVPGQASLASRRRSLLETADAVVFVSDTTRDAITQGRSYLHSARVALGAREGPTVGVVLQANKRDHADALPLGELRAALDAPDEKVAIIESVATDGSGIREAFVFAVRLALDRVRELMKCSLLKIAQPKIDSAEDLLQEFERREGGNLDLVALSGLRHTRIPTGEETSPSLPRADLPGGMIWPPVEGRLILHEATMQVPVLRQEANGDWCSVGANGWWIQSPASGEFRSLSAARTAMLEWARAHSAHAAMIGGRRCIALSEEGAESYRLWQCVSTSTTLREQIEQALNGDAAAIVETLIVAARALIRARTQWQDAGALPVRIDTVAVTHQGPRYAHLMPYPCVVEAGAANEDMLTFLRREFACVKSRLAAVHQELATVIAQRAQRFAGRARKADPAASLINLLLRA